MEQDDSSKTATGIVEAKQPKFQVAVPYGVRNVLDIDDLEEDEVAMLEAEFELKGIKKKD